MTEKRCETCRWFETWSEHRLFGRCIFEVPEDLPEWLGHSSNERHRKDGRRCIVWTPREGS